MTTTTENKASTDGQGPTAKPHLRERLLSSFADLLALPPVTPLIDGLLYRDTLAQLSGLPGCFKSFLAIAMACSLATGRNLGSFVVPKPVTVVYVAAEGASGLAVRIAAWCDIWGVDPEKVFERLHILPLPIQLGNTVDVSEAIEVVREVGAGLLILDTRARCTVGMEENSATEQGAAIEAGEAIRMATKGCTVWPMHHTPRSGGAGRGSNAWDGAVWSDLRMERDGMRATVRCAKHKDAPDGCDHHFKFAPHTVSQELMPGFSEKERSTLVLSGAGISAGNFEQRANSERVVLEIIRNSAPPEGLTKTEVVEFAKGAGVGKSVAYEAINRLLGDGYVENIGTEKRHRYVATDKGRDEPADSDSGLPD